MRDLLVLAGVVLGVNLLPAFAPPTWAVLVYFRITDGLPIAVVVVAGAVCAAAGRTLLAICFRALGARLPQRRRENLATLGSTLSSNRGVVASLLLFAVSPLPSNTLFEAAGLAAARLGPLVAAFFAGRLVSYSISVTLASHVAGSLASVFSGGLASPQGIALGVVGAVVLVAMVRINWTDVIERARRRMAHRVNRGRRGSPGGGAPSPNRPRRG